MRSEIIVRNALRQIGMQQGTEGKPIIPAAAEICYINALSNITRIILIIIYVLGHFQYSNFHVYPSLLNSKTSQCFAHPTDQRTGCNTHITNIMDN